jgi:hypothetical protein
VTDDHEQVQELLAGHALRALDVDEARRNEELMASHVPGCVPCRSAMEAFLAVSGELALAASPRTPPEILRARLRRDLRGRPRLRWVPMSAAGVAVAVTVGLSAWNAHLTSRVGKAELRQLRTAEVLSAVSHPQSQVVSFTTEPTSVGDAEGRALVQLAAAYVPGHGTMYLFGSMPAPHAHRVYQVWLVRNGGFASGGTFVPDRGVVLVKVSADPTQYDGLLVTEEPEEGSAQPSQDHVVTASL